MAEKGRPGVMFYFDLRPCLKRLTREEKGLLFECILDYAQHGVVPELEGTLGVAWDFIQPRIDHDFERYEEISESRRKAALKRWEGREEQPDANASGALQTMPTTTTTTTTTTNSSPTATPASTPPSGRARRMAPDREELAEELTFEDMRQRKMKMLSEMMGGW